MLCSVCMDSEEHHKRWLPLCIGNDQALLVRDVCVRPLCPRLQLCGHMCVTHKLEFELSWQGNYSVRACYGCRTSTLQLYSEKREVWFILKASKYVSSAYGVERRVKTPPSINCEASPTQKRGVKSEMRKCGMRQDLRRKPSRFMNQHVQNEQMLALEWSLGNLPLQKRIYLWRDNRKRSKIEKEPEACHVDLKLPTTGVSDVNARPEPRDIFCSTSGCRRFAKTGSRCCFHSSRSILFV